MLINKNENIFIEQSKRLILSKRFENLVGNKENDINIVGIKNLQNAKNENEIMSQEKIFIPGEKKEVVLLPKKFEIINEEKINDLYLKANKNKDVNGEQVKEFFPLINESVIDNLYIPSKEKIPLSGEKTQNIFIKGIKRENYINKIESDFKIENTQSIYIEPNIHDLSDNFQKEFIHEICIGYMIKPENDNTIDIKDTNKNMQLKGRQKKFDDISGENRDKFSIEGESQSQILPTMQYNNIIENNENFYIKGIDDDEEILKRNKLLLLNIIKKKNLHQICPRQNNVYIPGNDQSEIKQELYLLRNRNKIILKEIKPNKENNLFIKGSPKIPIKKQSILPAYQPNCQFSIFGKQKQPYIIENKGCFIINSCKGISKNKYLIVQGSCFGLFGDKIEPGQLTQAIEIPPKKNWNDTNRIQRFKIIIDADDKLKWSNLTNQRCVKFNILRGKHPSIFKIIKESQLFINKKEKLDELIENDYNYTSLEKDDKQRRTVKATISKVSREQVDEENDELDPFSACKKHSGRKYDKIFKERKTNSVLSKNDEEIKPGTVILKDDRDKKNTFMKFIDNNNKKGGNDIMMENERKTGPILFKNVNDKNKKNEMNVNYYPYNIGKSKSMGMFKSKEKKTEYLRDYDNEPRPFN